MSLPVFIGVTLVLAGGAAWMMGKALAENWRPRLQVIGYAVLLGLADRFIVYALFEGELLSLPGFLLDTAVLIAIALISYRITRVNTMIKQYPWLYRRAGPFAWREMK
ncbi:MAG: hypothetical protein U9Q71_00770 [Pseudomonadota bacterium]|nr:hypothetical protein [Pseudomonadota bacterium]